LYRRHNVDAQEIKEKVITLASVECDLGKTTIAPMESALFHWFTEAYNRGYCSGEHHQLTGDSLRGPLAEELYTPEDGDENPQKDLLIESVTSRWNNWTYALDHYKK
jgi:hypothetical protein